MNQENWNDWDLWWSWNYQLQQENKLQLTDGLLERLVRSVLLLLAHEIAIKLSYPLRPDASASISVNVE